MSRMGFSEKEIQEGKEYMRMKDFWQVYDSENYCNLLQAILNTYYNECPNTYSAEILDHQNSSRLIVKCNVCNGTQLSSYDPFISHNNGRNHKKNLVERQDASDNARMEIPVLIFKKMEDIENPFERDTFEWDLFDTTYDIIGYQFLYRERKNGGELITCQLCARDKSKCKEMKRSSALRHMQSEFHQNNYLRTKFDIKDSTIREEHTRQSFIADVIRKEGKLMHRILTIDSTDPNEEPLSTAEVKDGESKSVVGAEASSSGKEIIKDPMLPETPEQFLEIINDHLQYLNKNKGEDTVIKKLQDDPEAIELLISTANVLAQKIYMFSDNYNKEFKEQARKLLERCEKLRLPNQELVGNK